MFTSAELRQPNASARSQARKELHSEFIKEKFTGGFQKEQENFIPSYEYGNRALKTNGNKPYPQTLLQKILHILP